MGKKKTTKKPAVVPFDLVGSMLKAQQSKHGIDAIHTVKDQISKLPGIPWPSIALEWATHSRVCPTGKAIGIAGPQQCSKSGLALEMTRWAALLGGSGAITETEGNKIGGYLANGILRDMANRVLISPRATVEAAQEEMSDHQTFYKEKCPKRDTLFFQVLDSINGVGTEGTRKKIEKEGHAQRQYAETALLWSQFFQDRIPDLQGWPMTMIYVNHEKKDIDTGAKRRPGGSAQDFYAAIYFSLVRMKTTTLVSEDMRRIRIRVQKNSLGIDARFIDVDLLTEHPRGEPDRIRWAWDMATAAFLCEQTANEKSEIREAIGLVREASGKKSFSPGTRYNAQKLGLSKVTYTELHNHIHGDEKLLQEVRKALRILEYPLLPFVDGHAPYQIIETPKGVDFKEVESDAPDEEFIPEEEYGDDV